MKATNDSNLIRALAILCTCLSITACGSVGESSQNRPPTNNKNTKTIQPADNLLPPRVSEIPGFKGLEPVSIALNTVDEKVTPSFIDISDNSVLEIYAPPGTKKNCIAWWTPGAGNSCIEMFSKDGDFAPVSNLVKLDSNYFWIGSGKDIVHWNIWTSDDLRTAHKKFSNILFESANPLLEEHSSKLTIINSERSHFKLLDDQETDNVLSDGKLCLSNTDSLFVSSLKNGALTITPKAANTPPIKTTIPNYR
ncbi:MAG: hypothetical protein Q4A71_06850 [Actinomycetaceae bacterium]|nr:hypothetical protein [Actinomycetaceae bacterium]